VTLTGRNFGLPINRTVTIDNISVTSSGNDSLITFSVPNLSSVTSSGRRVTIVVNNTAGPTQAEVVVFPFVPTKPEGEVWVSLQEAPAGNLGAGNHTFVYRVLAQVNLDERYNIQVSADQTGWSAVVVDNAGAVISNPTIDIAKADPPGASQDVRVRVTIPSTGAASAKLTVRAVSQRNSQLVGVNGSGDTVTRGAAAPPPQVGITLTCFESRSSSDAATPNTTTPVTGPVAIQVTTNFWRLSFRAHFDSAGNYTATLLSIPDTHWTQTFTIAQPSTSKPVAVSTDNADQTIFVFFKATSGATASDVTLRIVKDDDNTKTAQYAQAVRL
jgi:hypothetical protein